MPTLKNGEVQAAIMGVRALQAERLSTLVGLKLRRIMRALLPVFEDMEEERQKLLRAHAMLDSEGEPVSDNEGTAVFPSKAAQKAFQEELELLRSGEVEVADSIILSDLRRKERDEKGKVSETDDLPGIVLDQLGPLLEVEDGQAG